MADFGITDTGFKRKRLNRLLQELNSEVKAIFGENFNVSPESPDGQINGIISESQANLWEIAEEAYNAFNPSAASGVALSNLVQLNYLTRLPATKSRVQVTLSGTPNTSIPAGSRIRTSDTGSVFATETSVTIPTSGSISLFASSVNTGPIQALQNTLTVIDTPISGWSSVTNSLDAIEGTNEETDSQLRARRVRSVARNSQSIVDSIVSAVSAVEGVTQTIVLENDTNEVDSNGLPPHSFQVVAVGGSAEDIAQAIWFVKPVGITSFGNQTVVILDSQGIPHNISFSRADSVDIYVEVTLTTFSEFPANGEALIKQAIVDYANGVLVEGRGFSLGDDVIYSRLYTPINSVAGHEVNSLFIGLSPFPTGESNISIGITEISNFETANISVIIS